MVRPAAEKDLSESEAVLAAAIRQTASVQMRLNLGHYVQIDTPTFVFLHTS